jgi:hypothetical protein
MGAVAVLGGIWEIVSSARSSRGRERQRDGFPLTIFSGYGAERREQIVGRRNAGARSNRYDGSPDNCLIVLEQARQDAEVDHPAGRLVDDIHDLGDGWRILVTGDDDGTGLDERLVTRVTQEGPHMPGLVLIHEVAGDVDADHGYLLPGRSLR